MSSDSEIDIENFGQIDEAFLVDDDESEKVIVNKQIDDEKSSFNEDDFKIDDLELYDDIEELRKPQEISASPSKLTLNQHKFIDFEDSTPHQSVMEAQTI